MAAEGADESSPQRAQMGLELMPEQRLDLGRAALDWVLSYCSLQSRLPVYPSIGAADLTAELVAPLPEESQDVGRVMHDFAAVVDGARHNGHPRMFGYVQSSGSFAGVAADFLASALNQNVTSWRSAPSATTIEHQVIGWLKEMVGFDAGGSGLLLSGGSFANFAALAVAIRASADADVNRLGIGALPGRPRVYASTMTHMSIGKAASMLGIGTGAIVALPVDGQYRMRPDTLAAAIAADRSAGHHPVCVVATAGDVNTGAIDPLEEIAEVCAKTGVWLHVDGSYGALAARSPHVGDRMRALGRADSLSLDPHKWLYAPVDVGCLLVKDGSALRRTFAAAADYIDVVADRQMSEFAYWDHSPELSRRFRALKIWFIVKIHGARALRDAIDRNIDAAQYLARLIESSGDFELVAPAPMSIVCFRYTPGDGRLREDAAARQDEFNKRLMLEVQRDGDSYVSNTMLNGRFALRACIVNFRTGRADVERLLETIRRVAARMA